MLDLHERMLVTAGNPPASPLGPKPKDLSARRAEAQRLSGLMADCSHFSYVRIGDMELTMLLGYQEGLTGPLKSDDGPVRGTEPYCNPGLSWHHVERLRRALESGSYVDFHDRIWPNSALVPKLKLSSTFRGERNPDAETSLLFLTWFEDELSRYGSGKRLAFVGAEAQLLRELSQTPSFLAAAAPFWPIGARISYHEVRDGGRNIDRNLDSIKSDLRSVIRAEQLHTVFLSLGGASKILCAELSREEDVRMFDAGSMLRALTYSGSDGNRSARSPHYPFLYRLPFETWCEAMERTWPHLRPEAKLAKIHAQLIYEVQRKEVGWTYGSQELDLSTENRAAFSEAYRRYLTCYKQLFDLNLETRRERARFLHFCGQHELSDEGLRYFRWFRAKSFIANLLPWRHS